MRRQLGVSQITDADCQQKIAEVYCKKLAAVDRPKPFQRSCPLDEESMSSPNHPVEGHVPWMDASEAEYREMHPVPLGILVLVFYERLLALVKHLVQGLWEPRHTFVLHVDPKAESSVAEDLRAWVASDPALSANVHIHSEVAVRRSGASLLAAELAGLRELLRRSPDWEYFVLLSDSDQLVRPPSFLQRFLALHFGRSFVNTEVLNGRPRSVAVECADRVHAVRMGGHEDGIPGRPGLTLASGSQFVVLFRAFAEFVMLAAAQLVPAKDAAAEKGTVAGGAPVTKAGGEAAVHEVLEEVVAFASPDETFFQTLILNTEFCTSHVRHSFHFHDTQGNILDETSQRYTDFPVGSPPTLAETHLPLLLEVRAHQPLVFARKFDAVNSSSLALLAQVDSMLAARTPTWLPWDEGDGWAAAATEALLGWRCKVRRGSVAQLDHAPDSVFDIMPAVYRIELASLGPSCLAASTPHALRGHRGHTRGTVHLTERFATPAYPNAIAGVRRFRGHPIADSPLVWLRVGTGWNADRMRYQGAVSLVAASTALRDGLTALLHWRPAENARRIRLLWRGPGNVALSSEETVPAWALLSLSRAPFRRDPPAPGWWTLEVWHAVELPQGSRRKDGFLIAARRFMVFDTSTPPSAEAIKLMFTASVPPFGIARGQA